MQSLDLDVLRARARLEARGPPRLAGRRSRRPSARARARRARCSPSATTASSWARSPAAASRTTWWRAATSTRAASPSSPPTASPPRRRAASGCRAAAQLEVIIEPEVPPADLRRCSSTSPRGRIVARHVDLASGAWSFAAAPAHGRMRARRERQFTSVHGPRWRMLIIGASEIAHLPRARSPRRSTSRSSCAIRARNTAARGASQGTHWIDGMPDDAVARVQARRPLA